MIGFSVALLAIASAQSSQKVVVAVARDEVYNFYEMRMPGELPSTAKPDTRFGPHVKLVLKSDGHFTFHLDNRVMMTVTMDGQGTYSRADGKIRLKGTAKSYMDDGYKKGTTTVPIAQEYRVVGDALFQDQGGMGTMILLREGGKAPAAIKEPKRAPSDSNGRAVVAALRQRYAALKSYADEGTMTSPGEGFMAKNARFSTRFTSPRKFCFKVASYEGKQEYDPRVVWANAKHAWLYWTDSGYGSVQERPISQAFGIMMSSGPETELVPELLLAKDYREPAFSHYDRFYAKPDQVVGGVKCAVLEMANERGAKTTLWISKQDGLIRQMWDEMTGAKVVFTPRANVSIPRAELTYLPPKAGLPPQ